MQHSDSCDIHSDTLLKATSSCHWFSIFAAVWKNPSVELEAIKCGPGSSSGLIFAILQDCEGDGEATEELKICSSYLSRILGILRDYRGSFTTWGHCSGSPTSIMPPIGRFDVVGSAACCTY